MKVNSLKVIALALFATLSLSVFAPLSATAPLQGPGSKTLIVLEDVSGSTHIIFYTFPSKNVSVVFGPHTGYPPITYGGGKKESDEECVTFSVDIVPGGPGKLVYKYNLYDKSWILFVRGIEVDSIEPLRLEQKLWLEDGVEIK